MTHFERDITEAFFLFGLDLFIEEAIAHRTQHGKAGCRWNGLYNLSNPPQGLPEPPDGIKKLISATAAPTWKDYAEEVRKNVKHHSGRIIFTLLISAFEGRLERLDYPTALTLGGKIGAIHGREKALTGNTVDEAIAGSILEIVNRRNDLIHADGVVRQEYLTPKQSSVAHSYWIQVRGWPDVGSSHTFDLDYLYYCATVLNFYARESPRAH